ncbi:heterokaryon incompatibility protein-domain-containing protein, partial [Cladorrhinum sp. PSN259]
MHLLNVNTFELEEFIGEQVKEIQYAILSHTWEGKEVSFQDIQRPDAIRNLEHPPIPAWSKVKNACAQARSDGYRYIWIDTCCIDKSSSAELQEAINSMFNWYLGSKSCYAFLSDVPPGADSIATSRWFTRGWTLQELFAPNIVLFFNSAWTAIGTRGDKHIVESISKSKTTRIEKQFLFKRNEYTMPTDVREFFKYVPVAQKMAWASGRQTTRIEDRAYSLLGLFDINMPLLYGEGDKAFQRLQHEIMRKSDDCTILAWSHG